LLLGLLCAGCEGALAERPRHLVLVTIDTLRADHLSCYGYARGTTSTVDAARRGSVPGCTIDDLAAQGTLFTRAFARAGRRFPRSRRSSPGDRDRDLPCRQSRHPPASARTLAGSFQGAGFATAAFT
jgi:hypothetical protein